ncbi:phenylalanine--tRNA ligase subunit beta [Tenacibaculum maritimum]|uniref:phenylalanine--tRNA ligase subunit beta n=2 Tax=Tenacibaculum maritimum TaxID=107401 RepID=UPI0012E4B623|nr:phenylalanine--tRNA ligase subunit beta [Tenacibaculum maritimum]MCD9561617.1 phenylalanine--tRNA ligase subunit beta [Tenacibaculum maritimum]MCD9565362.1 phenylalanine--tRNA ligase subunit beta [Tenacibaculum maritimum]MCD9579298.1 phenylalanine--tRNA ligase subunit beta [Tenacibaculum maritimum]MCD9597186.1 phenylalanine--tRNA ligase subunit beta [Tenacibaculum maritimum]CAA0189199.1 Phenylalanine--tRNA ligase beta subunit [Tenacibaculum maritimum]
MKISYNWLKQFLQIDWEPTKTGELLTDLGLEVEGIETKESIKGSLKGVVVGKVLTCVQHPNADRLRITTVDLGTETPVQIVCGAPNVAAGQKVPVATIGTVLYDEKGDSFKIKKGKIRGEESHGMICAEDELGLGKGHDGILVLDENLAPGTPVADVFKVETDVVFEIGLTPNRADAMSHFGVARDLRAGLIQKDINLELISPSVSDFHVDERTLKIDVEVENKDQTPRYCGITITDVEVKDSPEWIQNRLKAIGITPKNNIVDITNYVLHELGQPLHAFDGQKIKGNKVVVKTLPEGTKFTTLDDVERELSAEDIMICDGDANPLCIAGVFGGAKSGVTEHTSIVFLEAAYFNPVSVRKTAKRHGLNTDASFRFERGIDITQTKYALKRAALLIEKYAGGKMSSDIMDFYPEKIEDFQVFLSFENVYKLIGQKIPKETIKNILASLEIKINSATEGGLGLTIPSYRVDVQREADIIEEILRVYGYNNVEFSHKLNTSISFDNDIETKVENIVANQLTSLGFNETMANSLTKADYIDLSDSLNAAHNVEMLNPLSNDLKVMRQSLLFSGLESVAYNINRKQNSLKFYEFGKTYHKYDKGYQEDKHLTLFVTGNRVKDSWKMENQTSDFFYVKGIITNVLERVGITKIKTTPTKSDVFSEGIALSLGKIKLVEMGVVKRSVLKEFGIKQEVLFADFNWENVLQFSGKKNIKVAELPKYPAVKRDLALLLDSKTEFKEIYNLAFQSEKKLLKEVDLFDVYEGDKLPEGKKSYAVSFIIQDENKTLADKQIDKIMQKLQATFEKNVEAVLR